MTDPQHNPFENIELAPTLRKIPESERSANRAAVEELRRRIICFADIRERTQNHWTLTMQNGSRVELYPSTLGAGGSQHHWIFKDSFNLLKYLELRSVEDRMPSAVEDDFDVFEDF